MENTKKRKVLHGWDDEKIYFWDEEKKNEWCVSEEEELYEELVELCRKYFKNKVSDPNFP